MLSKTAWSIAAAGLCFIGYCIYFDRKRRSDPMFRDKLREKRKKARQLSRERKRSLNVDVNDPESMQRFFIQELHLGEELLSKGDAVGCVEHFGNAVAVCGRPQQILEALQRSLPSPVFQLLLQQLPSADERLAAKASSLAAQTQAVLELPD